MPLFGLVRMWVWGLVAVALWAGAALLIRGWYRNLPDPRPAPPPLSAVEAPPTDLTPRPRTQTPILPPPTFGERVAAWRPGADRATTFLAGGLLLTLIGLGGGRSLWWLVIPRRTVEPRHERGGEVRRVRRTDGTELHVEVYGRPDGPTVVLAHGWGATATEWYYLRRQLGGRFRLVAWDLPGLGLSEGPADKDYSLDRMAADLRAVLGEVGGPAVLVGHSIGGMVVLNFAKLFPDELGGRAVGLVPVHATHTNPVKTTRGSAVLAPLQRPVLEPLAYLMIALAPVVWLTNALSYLNGSLHWSNYRQLFSYRGTWGQVEFASRYVLHIWPATYARGTLGMFRYHATDALAGVAAPTLVVAADRDKMTRPEASEQIRDRIPACRLLTLRPAGHMGLLSSHEEFGRAVQAFAEECHAAHRPVAAAHR